MKILAAAATILIAGSAVAGPCKEAERGTYLSNVCFLVETFSNGRAEIAAADERECTARLAKPYTGLSGDTIHFNRANLREIEMYHLSARTSCWRAVGADGDGPDARPAAAVCGKRIELARLNRAFVNLFAKYCKGKTSEF